MRPPTRLLLFVLVPLAVAIGGVAWVLERQVATGEPTRRPLPATTQLVSGRAGLAWAQPWTNKWAAFGIVEPGRYFSASLQRGTTFDVASGDAKGGLMLVSTSLKSPITGPGVADDGLLFAPTGASDVTAVDLRTFRAVWTAEVGTPGAHLAVGGGRLVARTIDRIACFDAPSGRSLWTVKNANATAGPALAGPYACFASDKALHVLDPAGGRELRRIPVDGLWGRIVIDGDRAYACAPVAAANAERGVAIYAFDLVRGTIAWKWVEPAPAATPPSSAWIDFCGPVVGGGVVVVAIEHRLCAVDAATGHRRWLWVAEPIVGGSKDSKEFAIPMSVQVLRTPAVIDGVVYATWGSDRVSGWDAASGREVWRYTPADRDKRSARGSVQRAVASLPPAVPAAAANGLLLAGTDDGLLALRCDLLPQPRPTAAATPAARALNLPWAVGGASCVLLVAIILGVFGLWRLSLAAASAVLCGVTVWAWVRSYGASDFVGYVDAKQTFPFVAEARRGVTSRDGSLEFGAWHRVDNEPRRRSATPAPARAPRTAPPPPGATASSPTRPEWRWEREPEATDAVRTRASLIRFAWTKQSRSSGVSLGPQAETSLTLPHWFVAAVLGVAPMAWVTGLWRDRRRRHPRGHCRDCGYDLRGITGRCPECGLEIATKRMFGRVRG